MKIMRVKIYWPALPLLDMGAAIIPMGRSSKYYIVCKAGPCMPAYYTLIHEDNKNRDLLVSFTHTGHGCSYHSNGAVK